MEKEMIRKHTKETFSEVYDNEYKLLEIRVNNSQQVNYIIVEETSGVIVDFWVSGYAVFDAKSNQGLLQSQYECKQWLEFMTRLEDKLKEEFRKEKDND